MIRFESWLVAQQARKDFIGDFACFWGVQDIPPVLSELKLDEHKRWAVFVCRIAQPGHVTAFNEAWQEFLLVSEIDQDGYPHSSS